MIYPEAINTRLANLTHCPDLPNANAEGIGVNLACGSTVRFFLRIEDGSHIADAAFRSNGCGHSRVAADVLAQWVTNKLLAELHGLDDSALREIIENEIGEIPDANIACITAAISALKDAFANFRSRRREEFRGEKALICTCFGVTEERIEDLIAKSQASSVEQVTDLSGAGGGCGSCRMLIQELLDMQTVVL
ncbi:MAG: (2Fe-2S)-binding protein [Pyrinomonadaceae bacterium]